MLCCSEGRLMTSTMDDDDKTNSNNTNKTTTAVAGTHAETPRVDTEAIEADREIFDSFFSTRKPKDGWAGLSSGLKSVTKGVAGGLAALVSAPIVGMQQDGAKGLVTGACMGVASAVALPVTGVCVGVYQVGRGLVNSAAAVQCANQGMVWNEVTREWEFYELEQDLQQIAKEEEIIRQKAGGGGSGDHSHNSSERPVADRTYYDLLQVSTNVNNVQLKKAYYKQSRVCHPDRNHGANKEEAHRKFQDLSHAYQILSNEQSRAYYDKHGLETEETANNELRFYDMDPKIFFAVMFASDAVRPYIGELWLSNKADSIIKDEFFQTTLQGKKDGNGGDDDDQAQPDTAAMQQALLKRSAQEDLQQRRRVVECAMFLRNRIEPFCNGTMDETEFILACQEEAATIATGSFGDVFATAIGFSLEVEAAEFIGAHTSFMGVNGQAAKWKKKGHAWGNQWKVVSSGIGAARAGAKAYKEMEQVQKKQDPQAPSGTNSDPKQNTTINNGPSSKMMDDAAAVEKATQQIEASLPVFLELAWALNIQDITQTLVKVCEKLFHDQAETLDLEARLRRAEAVRLLGREFHEFGVASKKTNFKNVSAQELRTRAEVAAMTTMAKAQGQDIDDKDAEEMIKQAKNLEAQRQAYQG